ncbi:hypothetical protein IAQ61_000072 [Plenodomus lingam]|uniref:uncharacterized protein n=1 Tax=Leptosphaeria maculans TaxID=5022 RepID=UPI00331E742A|nr:hypothetical protein IAQ61_000072 [Plenodomus lingam]
MSEMEGDVAAGMEGLRAEANNEDTELLLLTLVQLWESASNAREGYHGGHLGTNQTLIPTRT